jgi:ABC-type transport system involved in cytochrome c biogenesis permease subunit
MEIKQSIQGLLIYITMVAYLQAFIVSLVRRREVVPYLIGVAFAVVAYGYYWYYVGHVPLENLFEVFLFATMAAHLLAFIVSLLQRPKAGHVLYLIGVAFALVAYGYRWYDVGHMPLQNLFEVSLFLTIVAYLQAFVLSLLGRLKTGHILYFIGFAAALVAYGYRWYHIGHVPLYNLFDVFLFLTMAACLQAFTVSLLGALKAGHVLYLIGFAVAVVSYGYRWYDVRHVPLQNLFEVFLFLGMIYPVSLLCRRFLRVGGYAADMLIGVIVLFPAGFVFNAQPQQLPPALQSWLFTPHVAVYMLSYILMAKATVQAFYQLIGKRSKRGEDLLGPEQATYRMVCVGFPLLTLGLILGSYWGKLAWGDYWGWDPKELWSLASWLVFLGYFHFRYMFGKKHPRINSLWAIAGMGAIIITLLWVNLSKLFPGLHSYA